MKISLFASLAFSALALTSCLDQRSRFYSTDDDPEPAGPTELQAEETLDRAAPEAWMLCDLPLTATRITDRATGQQYLSLTDARGGAYLRLHAIDLNIVPLDIRMTIKSQFAGGSYTVQAWEAMDSRTTQYLFESVEMPGVVVTTGLDGAVNCKGSK